MIDKSKIYESGELRFVNFTQLSMLQKKMVLNWRNSEQITKWMFDKQTISLDNHLQFIENLTHHLQKFYWLVLKNESPIGVVNMVDYNNELKSAEWGFYLNPELFMSNLGFELFFESINLFFDCLKMNTLYGFVQIDNKNALILNSFFGMRHQQYETKFGHIYSHRKMELPEWENDKKTLVEARKNFIQYIKINGKQFK